jgi:uncharacterized protein YggT (Ycf19 family)
MIINLIRLLFTVYTLILFAYIILSWFPTARHWKISHFLRFYTEPYLNIFRRIIPPIGGVIDLSPLLAFFALQVLEYLIIKIVIMI